MYIFDPASPRPVAVQEKVAKKTDVVCAAFDPETSVSNTQEGNAKMSKLYFLTKNQVCLLFLTSFFSTVGVFPWLDFPALGTSCKFSWHPLPVLAEFASACFLVLGTSCLYLHNLHQLIFLFLSPVACTCTICIGLFSCSWHQLPVLAQFASACFLVLGTSCLYLHNLHRLVFLFLAPVACTCTICISLFSCSWHRLPLLAQFASVCFLVLGTSCLYLHILHRLVFLFLAPVACTCTFCIGLFSCSWHQLPVLAHFASACFLVLGTSCLYLHILHRLVFLFLAPVACTCTICISLFSCSWHQLPVLAQFASACFLVLGTSCLYLHNLHRLVFLFLAPVACTYTICIGLFSCSWHQLPVLAQFASAYFLVLGTSCLYLHNLYWLVFLFLAPVACTCTICIGLFSCSWHQLPVLEQFASAYFLVLGTSCLYLHNLHRLIFLFLAPVACTCTICISLFSCSWHQLPVLAQFASACFLVLGTSCLYLHNLHRLVFLFLAPVACTCTICISLFSCSWRQLPVLAQFASAYFLVLGTSCLYLHNLHRLVFLFLAPVACTCTICISLFSCSWHQLPLLAHFASVCFLVLGTSCLYLHNLHRLVFLLLALVAR